MEPQDHLVAADEFLEAASKRENSVDWALVEVEIAKAHYLAAAVKQGLAMTGSKKAHGLSLIAKLAK